MIPTKKKFLKNLFLLFLYFAVTFTIEVFYRHPLFDVSFKLQKRIYHEIPEKYIIIFKVLTFIGTKNLIIPFCLLIFLLFPVTISFILLAEASYAAYLTGVLKGVYGEKRPFWDDFSIMRRCDPGYGNPSGHCITVFSFYISFVHIICSQKFVKKKCLDKTLKIMLFLMIFILGICIGIARICMISHSINQVIFGIMLGLGIYFYYIYVLKLHKFSSEEFTSYLFKKQSLIYHSIKYVFMLTFLIVFPLFRKNETEKYEALIDQYCPDLTPFRKFNQESVYSGICLFFLFGFHLGLVITFYSLKKKFSEKQINNWYKTTPKFFIIRLLLIIPCFIPLLLNKIGSVNLYMVVFVEQGGAIFLIGFFLASLYMIICIKINPPSQFDEVKQLHEEPEFENIDQNSVEKNPNNLSLETDVKNQENRNV